MSAAELMTVTQEMNKLRLALRTCGGWSQREREQVFTWGMVPEVGCDRHLGTGRFDRTPEARGHFGAEALVWVPEFSLPTRCSSAGRHGASPFPPLSFDCHIRKLRG